MQRPAKATLLFLFAVCASGGAAPLRGQQLPAPRAGSAYDSIAFALAQHTVNRLTFGARPSDEARVWSIGVERWVEEQLAPDSLPDRAADAAMRHFPAWTIPIDSARAELATVEVTNVVDERGRRSVMFRVSGIAITSREASRDSTGQVYPGVLTSQRLLAGRLARAEFSERQLLEVMTDFWLNHFNLYAPLADEMLDYDRRVLRANALGRFRDLLGAVAKHPSMLLYLNNDGNSASSLNENFARELLELHTMGADGGFTQSDVISAARALTGWGTGSFGGPEGMMVRGPASGRQRMDPRTFSFDSNKHDYGLKPFLGYVLDGKTLEAEGDLLLDIIARHPSTARFISRKLSQRFIGDDPPSSIVDRAAATFTRTDGDIREVVRTIVTSVEFRTPSAHNTKFKSPLEFLLSVRRSLGLPVDTTGESIDVLIKLGQPMFGKIAPNGWPEVTSSWDNVGAFREKLNFITDLVNNRISGMSIDSTLLWRNSSEQPFASQMHAVIADILGGRGRCTTDRARTGSFASHSRCR